MSKKKNPTKTADPLKDIKLGKLPISDKEWIESCIKYGHSNNLECRIAYAAALHEHLPRFEEINRKLLATVKEMEIARNQIVEKAEELKAR